MLKKSIVLVALSGAFSLAAMADEFPIGEPVIKNNLQVAAVYLVPQLMDIEQGGDLSKFDIHLEADIHATEGNKNGFEEGEWIPHLTVNYKLQKEGGPTQEGVLIPMVADDGPHYGKNVKLNGHGKYKLTLTIHNPGSNKSIPLARHTSKENGVAEWFNTFDAEYSFEFNGFKK